jgi:hypothetical protein
VLWRRKNQKNRSAAAGAAANAEVKAEKRNATVNAANKNQKSFGLLRSS